MTKPRAKLVFLPCLDSDDMAAARRAELAIPRATAAALGRSAVDAATEGHYLSSTGCRINWRPAVQTARLLKRSIPPDMVLPSGDPLIRRETRTQVGNETTLQASKRLTDRGSRPLALNFANGIRAGGGFLEGALAQEEVLCRSSALHHTLVNDPMYEAHRQRPRPDSTAWAIYSPDVPVFREDDGTALDQPWLLSCVTCAAPYAPAIGQPESGDLLRQRIHRVLGIARAFGHRELILGAWGCGAFGNDPRQTASDFRSVLETDFSGAFDEIAFAITDWSPERRFLGPFREVFSD